MIHMDQDEVDGERAEVQEIIDELAERVRLVEARVKALEASN